MRFHFLLASILTLCVGCGTTKITESSPGIYEITYVREGPIMWPQKYLIESSPNPGLQPAKRIRVSRGVAGTPLEPVRVEGFIDRSDARNLDIQLIQQSSLHEWSELPFNGSHRLQPAAR